MNRRQRRRLLITTAILFSVASMLSLLYSRGIFEGFQRQLTDVFFITQAANPKASQYVVLVAIDDKSIVELKRVRPILRLAAHPVRRRHPEALRGPRPNHRLRRAVRRRRPTTTRIWRRPSTKRPAGATFVVLLGGGRLIRCQRHDPDTAGKVTRDLRAACRSSRMSASGPGAGRLKTRTRTARFGASPLVFNVNGEPYPSLPLIAVAAFPAAAGPWDGPIAENKIPLAGREIPIDARGRHHRQLRRRPVPERAAGVPGRLVRGRAAQAGSPPETFRSKLVMVGMTATGFADDYWTPTLGSRQDARRRDPRQRRSTRSCAATSSAMRRPG